jgi:hypothetical protein
MRRGEKAMAGDFVVRGPGWESPAPRISDLEAREGASGLDIRYKALYEPRRSPASPDCEDLYKAYLKPTYGAMAAYADSKG